MSTIPEKSVIGWDVLEERVHQAVQIERAYPEVGMEFSLHYHAQAVLKRSGHDLQHTEELVRRYKARFGR